MRGSVLTLGVVAACWAVATSEPYSFTLAPAFIALAAIKGALFLKTVANPFGSPFFLPGIGKRSIPEDHTAQEELLLSTAAQLDANGCLLKLMCSLQTKDAVARTPQETILATMFRENSSESLTSYNTAFVYASEMGSKTRDAATCDKLFSKCPLKYSQLSAALTQSWGCFLIDQQDLQ